MLKGDGYLQAEVSAHLEAHGCTEPVLWRVDDTHHCGGYARSNPSLAAFLSEFAGISDIPIEPVYTGKLFYALFDLIEKAAIPSGTEIGGIHGKNL